MFQKGEERTDFQVCCPYNQNHQMPQNRLQWHILKCKDKEKYGHLFQNCQYNVLHIIKKEKMVDHLKTCKDKKNYDRQNQGNQEQEDAIAKAIQEQFKKKEPHQQDQQQQQQELKPGQDDNQVSSKKKRIRKNDKKNQKDENEQEQNKQWYEKSYGEQLAQNLMSIANPQKSDLDWDEIYNSIVNGFNKNYDVQSQQVQEDEEEQEHIKTLDFSQCSQKKETSNFKIIDSKDEWGNFLQDNQEQPNQIKNSQISQNISDNINSTNDNQNENRNKRKGYMRNKQNADDDE